MLAATAAGARGYEDVHRIDPMTLELLHLVVQRVRHRPVLVLISSRPDFSPPLVRPDARQQLPLNRLGQRRGRGAAHA